MTPSTAPNHSKFWNFYYSFPYQEKDSYIDHDERTNKKVFQKFGETFGCLSHEIIENT